MIRLTVATLIAFSLLPGVAHAASCPRTIDPGAFASEKTLRELTAKQARFGSRPTASENQAEYVAWLEAELTKVHGLKVTSERYRLERWDPRSTTLTADGRALDVAAPVPYSNATTVTAPLAHLAAGVPITAENAAGRIVVRARPQGTPLDEPEDIRAASDAGAAGIVFASDLPADQLRGLYRPYEGVPWRIPGVYVGADEAAALANAATATLAARATTRPATTRMLLARLPGRSNRRLVVESHTDGVNALWDNGPLVMLAMARSLAKLPEKCRPRTIEFAFTTAHLYQSRSSADRLARRLDREYDDGKVAAVMAVEHFGARRYELTARPAGAPGRQLRRTNELEPLFVGVSQSPAMKKLARTHLKDVDGAIVSPGLDAAVPGRVPVNCNFGGEGNPHHRRLLPTIGAISGSQVLFTPGFGIEAIDFTQMHGESLAFTDLLLALARTSDRAIAGDIPSLRRRRAAGAPGCAEKDFSPRAARATGTSAFFCTLTSHLDGGLRQ